MVIAVTGASDRHWQVLLEHCCKQSAATVAFHCTADAVTRAKAGQG